MKRLAAWSLPVMLAAGSGCSDRAPAGMAGAGGASGAVAAGSSGGVAAGAGGAGVGAFPGGGTGAGSGGRVDASGGSAPTEPSGAPTGLICELLRHPELTNISDSQPELGYIAPSGAMQSAYRILVATSQAKLDADEGDAWDSGKVMSAQSIDIEYAGAALLAGASYFWKVQSWDAGGAASPWSATQEFKTAAQLGQYSTPREPVVKTTLAPAALAELAAGHYFLDFGRDAFGWLELDIDALAAGTVQVRLGEKAKGQSVDTAPGGSIRYASVQLQVQAGKHSYRVATPKDTRNTSGDAVLLPAELGVVMPFRYVELQGGGLKLEASAARQVALHYPCDDSASSFDSASATLNDVWAISKYSIIAPTFAGVYIDGDRERIPYEGDAYLQQLGHYSIDREFALARYSHEYLLEKPTWPTEWKQHSVMMAWADWMYTGNTEALSQAYARLVSEKTLEQHVNADGLLDSSTLEDLVDWPEGERDGHVLLGVNTVVNAFWAKNLQQMAQMAGALGKAADATRYQAMAQKAITALNDELSSSSTGLYVDGVGTSHSSLHSNMLPLAFGFVPAARRAQVTAFVKSRGMACSVYGAQYLLEALFRAGEAEAALALLTNDSDRGWVNMLRAGATITMEAWDAKYKPNLDWNHAWGAAPANLLPRYVLGVQPLEPGFAVASIAPQPGSLSSFSGTVPTIRGGITVEWQGNAASLAFELPGNMRANVALPGPLASCAVLLDDAPATPAEREGALWLDGVGPGKHVAHCP